MTPTEYRHHRDGVAWSERELRMYDNPDPASKWPVSDEDLKREQEERERATDTSEPK